MVHIGSATAANFAQVKNLIKNPENTIFHILTPTATCVGDVYNCQVT